MYWYSIQTDTKTGLPTKAGLCRPELNFFVFNKVCLMQFNSFSYKKLKYCRRKINLILDQIELLNKLSAKITPLILLFKNDKLVLSGRILI